MHRLLIILFRIISLSLAKKKYDNLRGLRDNYMPAELAEIRRQGIFTRFKGIIQFYFEKVLSVRNNFDYFCTIELRRIDL